MGVRVRENGLGRCCILTAKAVKPNPANMQTVNCARCRNQMWYRANAWEWFAYRRLSTDSAIPLEEE